MSALQIQQLAEQSTIKFGTSGLRGLVSDLTDEVCFAYTKAFLQSQELQSASVAIGYDLRPSSIKIAEACCAAVKSLGLEVKHIGALPTPALAHYGLALNMPCIMVTGSHIPFDRNGIKFYRADGEISKADEEAIMAQSVDLAGCVTSSVLPMMDNEAMERYVARYVDFFGSDFLKGKTVAIYQHSSVGRDLLDRLMQALGAQTILLGRSDDFVPIDTEAVAEKDVDRAKRWAEEHAFDLLVSTDGDADRPLIADETGIFLRGDILGILTAKYLKADAVVTPVSSNTSLEKSHLFQSVLRTKIGSPFVIEGMQKLLVSNPTLTVVGYEANGGFLLGSRVCDSGGELAPLPTRDAVLSMLAVLGLAKAESVPVSQLTAMLPARYTYSDRLTGVDQSKSNDLLNSLRTDRERISELMAPMSGACKLQDETDGLRVTFVNGDIVHLRPSGNAPELRCYAESQTPDRARLLVDEALDRLKRMDLVS